MGQADRKRLRAVREQWAAHRRFQPAVLGLLRAPGAVGAAHAQSAGSHAGLHCARQPGPFKGGCFAGPEGAGCALSAAEILVLARVQHEPMSWEV